MAEVRAAEAAQAAQAIQAPAEDGRRLWATVALGVSFCLLFCAYIPVSQAGLCPGREGGERAAHRRASYSIGYTPRPTGQVQTFATTAFSAQGAAAIAVLYGAFFLGALVSPWAVEQMGCGAAMALGSLGYVAVAAAAASGSARPVRRVRDARNSRAQAHAPTHAPTHAGTRPRTLQPVCGVLRGLRRRRGAIVEWERRGADAAER